LTRSSYYVHHYRHSQRPGSYLVSLRSMIMDRRPIIALLLLSHFDATLRRWPNLPTVWTLFLCCRSKVVLDIYTLWVLRGHRHGLLCRVPFVRRFEKEWQTSRTRLQITRTPSIEDKRVIRDLSTTEVQIHIPTPRTSSDARNACVEPTKPQYPARLAGSRS
jgi:hypothetical protein